MTAPLLDVVRVDTSSRASIEAALTRVGAFAARQLHHRDCEPWVRAHRILDLLLDDWRKAPR